MHGITILTRREGLSFVSDEDTDAVLAAIAANPYDKDATVIGEVVADHAGKVFMETRIGGGANSGYAGGGATAANMLAQAQGAGYRADGIGQRAESKAHSAK